MGFIDVSFFVFLSLSFSFLFVCKNPVLMQWDSITTDMLGKSNVQLITPAIYACIRLLFACCIWYLDASYLLDPIGITFTSLQRDGQKKAYLLRSFERLIPFSDWSWILQGIYFTLTGYHSLSLALSSTAITDTGTYEVYGVLPPLPIYLQQLAWVLFEISLPIAFMVSIIVSRIIIPSAKKNNLPTENFFKFNCLLLHNANIWFIAIEFILNCLYLQIYHLPFILMYGLFYAIFAWIWHYYRGFYYYFFLDYERPYSLVWYAGLLFALAMMFGVFCLWSWFRNEYHWWISTVFILILAWLTTKLRDA